MTESLHGRWYGDACGTAFAMELLGERWSMLIVRELLLGPRRFTDLRAALAGISARTLTERLDSLLAAGVMVNRELPGLAKARVYELTRFGYAAEPMIQAAGRWAVQSSGHDTTLPVSPVAFMISLRTMVDLRRLVARRPSVGFEIGEDAFVAEPRKGELAIRRAEQSDAPAIAFHAPAASPLAALFYAKVPLANLSSSGVRVEGDPVQVARFIDLFELPPKLT